METESMENEKQPLLAKEVPRESPRGIRGLWRHDFFPCIPARYVLAIMSFFGFVNVYALRVNLSMAIVPMVNNSANASSNIQYNWTSEQQGWILSSFFYGYMITQIPGGYLAGIIGGRYIYGIGIVMTAVLSLLTPLAAKLHFGTLIGLRILEGLFEGVTFPAMHAIWGKWAPPAERSILTTITYAGPYFGNIISFPVSALLCEYGFGGGWPSVFYVFGIIGIVWFIFWLILGFDSPATHPRISQSEREYIETSISAAKLEENEDKLPTPWLHIMTSPAVWAMIIAHFCNNWGGYTLLTCIPSYFKDALGLSFGKDLIQNGIFSGIPYVAFAIAVLASGQIADFLRRRWLSTVVVRKLFTCSAFILAAAGLVIVGYVGTSKFNSVLYLSFSVGFSGMAITGFHINHIDLAPQYAGVLMGITNSVATIPGIIGPLIAKTIAHKPVGSEEDYQSMYKEEWREVFIIAAEVYLFGAVVYLILGEGKRQWWAGGSKGIERKRMEYKEDFKKDDKLVISESLASSIEFDNEPHLKRKSGMSIQHPSFN